MHACDDEHHSVHPVPQLLHRELAVTSRVKSPVHRSDLQTASPACVGCQLNSLERFACSQGALQGGGPSDSLLAFMGDEVSHSVV
jgi:hypothetical protein